MSRTLTRGNSHDGVRIGAHMRIRRRRWSVRLPGDIGWARSLTGRIPRLRIL
jgi:hypothetical protein